MKKQQDSTKTLALRLKAVGDPSRMKILCLLLDDAPVCVSSIAEMLGVSVASASHHLLVLAKEELLEPVRDGKHVCYRLTKNQLTQDIKRLVCKYNVRP